MLLFHRMAEKLVIGGFASTKKQIQTVANILSEHLDADVEGLNFREARAKCRAFFDGRNIITHSGGMVTIAHSEPHSVLAIAPPVPEFVSKLLWRGWLMGRKLNHLEVAVKKYCDTSQYEALRHPKTHFGCLPEISHFNAFTSAQQLAAQGVKTTIALMKKDGIFHYPDQFDENPGGSYQTVVIDGEHVDFTNHPIETLGAISLAQEVYFPQTLDSKKLDFNLVNLSNVNESHLR